MSEIEDDFEPICEMKFVETQTKKTIIVRLGPPIFDEEKALYYCISELEGLELERLENGNLKGLEEGQRRRTYGESVFHALELVLVRFNLSFARLNGDFKSEDGASPWVVFPKRIPWVYGSDVYDRLCKTVDDEVQKIEDERTLRREGYERNKGNS